ncbi:MAG TPA: serine/threonine-protein kinase [Polyangiaceae bacterium]|jgi:serine/threonine protein kinase
MPEDFFGLSGHVIDGQFHAHEVAGEGGFSVVYRGQHLTMREPIAIKCLKLKLKNTDPQIVASFTQRFFDESRIMYRLSQGNLNIARAITTGVTMSPKTQATVPYMVLEWLEGVSLAKELKDRRAKKLPMPSLKDVLNLFEPAALAIAYAHAQGVVHRDVKPGNLFLQNTREGQRMKVLDFGMAKVLQPEAMGGLESAETLAGVTVLSPQYVTPEQLDRALGPVGPWTDVYAFALILSEALTNKRAREAESFVDLMTQMAKGEAPTPRRRGATVTDAVEEVFARAFARDPKARPADLGAFWRQLVDASAKPDMDAFDIETKVDASMPALAAFGSTMVMPPAPRTEPKVDLSKTMPLSNRTSAAPALRRFSGTVPMSATPEPSAARVSVDPRPPPAPSSAPRISEVSPRISEPRMSEPRISEPRISEPRVSRPSPPAPAPRSRGVLTAFLLLFILASLAVSAFLLTRLYLIR